MKNTHNTSSRHKVPFIEVDPQWLNTMFDRFEFVVSSLSKWEREEFLGQFSQGNSVGESTLTEGGTREESDSLLAGGRLPSLAHSLAVLQRVAPSKVARGFIDSDESGDRPVINDRLQVLLWFKELWDLCDKLPTNSVADLSSSKIAQAFSNLNLEELQGIFSYFPLPSVS
ncbi:MAG: hypothetical protein KDD42_00705 [Bdellovibrionales bacterium]|nr:hypothetical protein [Bdellovibrionales bacterium]